jgi:hypothetical protein
MTVGFSDCGCTGVVGQLPLLDMPRARHGHRRGSNGADGRDKRGHDRNIGRDGQNQASFRWLAILNRPVLGRCSGPGME